MSLVDTFIANESFEGFVLDEADYSEIAFGIIIGNLDKINNFSPNFLRNLRANQEISKEIKIVLLCKVFEIIQRKTSEVGEKERNTENILIDFFTEAAGFLVSLSDLGQLWDYTQSIVYSTFESIVNKCLGNSNILRVIISCYPFQDLMGLKNNIFIYEADDLEYILSNSFENPERNFDLIKTGFSVICDLDLTPKELLSIVSYRLFYEYLCFLLKNKEFFNFPEVQKVLTSYSKCLTFKQTAKIKEVLRNLEINYSVSFQFKSEASEERGRKNYENKNFNKSYLDYEEFDEWSSEIRSRPRDYGYDHDCYEAERDYQLYESNPNMQRIKENRPNFNYPKADNRSYRQSSQFKQNRFRNRNRNSYQRENDVEETIKNGLRDVIIGIRDKSRENIDTSVLRDLLVPFVEKNQTIVFSYLERLSYHEQKFTQQSIILWSSLCDALSQIQFFDREYLGILQYNLRYIKDNQGYY